MEKKKKKRRRKKEEEVSSEEDLIKIVITISLDGAIAIIKCLGILGGTRASSTGWPIIANKVRETMLLKIGRKLILLSLKLEAFRKKFKY